MRRQQEMNELKFYKSSWRAIKLMLMCSVFFAFGLWLLTMPDSPKWVGLLTVFFFGLGYPVGLFHLFDKRPQIRINELGVWDRSTTQELISWEFIQKASLAEVHGQKFICLQIDPQHKLSTREESWNKTLVKLNKMFGFQELNIPLGQIKVDEIKLTEFICTMLKTDTKDRVHKIKYYKANMSKR